MHDTLVRTFFASAFAVALAAPAVAQNTAREKSQALLTAAHASLKAGDTAQAVKQLEQARKTDPKFFTPHLEYGQLISATSNMGVKDLLKRKSAADALKDASDLEPDNPWPYLELGRLRLKMPLMRIAAENLFKDALDAAVKKGVPDAVADITYEIGQIYDRRYRTDAHRHMIVGNTNILDPIAAQYEPDYIDWFMKNSTINLDGSGELNQSRAEGWYRQGLAAQPGHELTAIAFAALLYEGGRYSEMVTVAHNARVLNPASARLHLAEGLALLRLKKVPQASDVLEAGVKLMTDRERNMVAALGPIVRPPDARAYETLDAATRAAYDKAYWELADPLYLTSVNEQRLAFLGRVAYSDLMFSTEDLKVRGALTDRGQIVLRYGEPPVIATFQPDVQNKNEGETMGRITTLWYYPEPKLKFVFVGPPGMTNATFAGEFYGYADELRYTMPVRYDSLPNGLRKPDTIPVQVARFRGTQPLATRVELHADVPTNKLAAAAGAGTVPVETAFMLFNAARARVVDSRDTLKVAPDEKDGRVRSFNRQFMPGEYMYRVEALQEASMANARAAAGLSIVNFPTDRFAVSDLLVGTDLKTPVVNRRDDLDMKVLPTSTLDPNQPLALYWESYGAKPTADGSVKLRVELSLTLIDIDRPPAMHIRVLGAISDALGTSGEGEKKVSTSFDRIVAAPPVSDDRVLHAVTLKMESAPPGQYLLEVKMTDLESGQSATSTHGVRIRRPEK
ncbi:MAG TPA: GWxTD domain-containing protein [Gemmatimonadaceae bacterium]|nr:GWxTD domain-containing protein [Gemmatimonadaceae bacterium]